MLIKMINHITINVKNLEDSLKFYRDILGLEQLDIVNMGDHELIYFALPGGTRLELITYFGTNQDINTNPSDGGIFRHIAFEVDDVRDVEKWMLENAIEVTLSITRVPKLGVYAILVKDPNGVELEFIQKF
ncbi:VOC family protein [Paenibacillus frigoriresistens]|uniref:VOC family protein n=1 Tax=Paenibacillus alginolyticus TaxID=59839 RepID=UPI0015674DCE|nr:VOC family protein [Paenibacillus frigoriresistens]NRF95107.1 VOC family protein [Paenibacillus frigoriresistens]